MSEVTWIKPSFLTRPAMNIAVNNNCLVIVTSSAIDCDVISRMSKHGVGV